MWGKYFLLQFLSLFFFAQAQVQFPGNCPNLSVVEPFDLQKYLGTWYEIEKYPARFESGGKCVFAVYTLNPNGTIQVRNSNIRTETGVYDQIIGSARLADPTGKQAKLLVTFPTAPVQREAPYWVLQTDYDYYAIVWSCTPTGENNMQFLWYLSRTRNPDDDERSHSREIMRQLSLDTTHLVPTDQSRCPNPYAIL
jgi:apolipoprotein D and lipocalin family protein